MKIKTWLLLSYFVVMLLPLVFAYSFYVLISLYNQKLELQEYVQMNKRLAQIEVSLQDASLYRVQEQSRYEEKLTSSLSDVVQLLLYNKEGVKLFVGGQERGTTPVLTRESPVDLYKDLYSLKTTNREYSIKKPYIEQGEILGFYQITLLREDWIKGINIRTKWILYGFIPFFLILYGTVWRLVDRKLNRPLAALMERMTAFARNEKTNPIEYKSQDEVGKLITHFQQMEEEIKETQNKLRGERQAKEIMIASLGHDLKTPLTTIRAFTEALSLKQMEEKEKQEYLSVMLEKTDYMKQLVDDLTQFTLLQSADYQIQLVLVEGEEFFDMLFTGYDELAESRNITLTKTIAVRSQYLMNETQIIRLTDNLMSNAFRYTPSGSVLHLAVISSDSPLPQWVLTPFRSDLEHLKQEYTLLIVQDEGEGIPLEDQDKIFLPFYQVEASRTAEKFKSSGLGLSIAKMIVEKHHGRINLYSKVGLGTIIACAFPEAGDETDRRNEINK